MRPLRSPGSGGARGPVAVLGSLALTATALAGPPPESLARLSAALHALDDGTFLGSYTATIEGSVGPPGGPATDTSTVVLGVTAPPTGKAVRRVVRAEKNGKDITAEAAARAGQAQAEGRKGKDSGGQGEDFGFRVPEGEDARHFSFGPTECVDDLCAATFAPTAASHKEKGLASGRLAWSATTGDPVWLEATPTDLPSGVKELMVRLEFARTGELLYPARVVTEGVGGFLFVKRAFRVTRQIGDLRSEAAATEQGASPRL